METERALQQLELLQKKLYAYHCADSSLYLDAVTTAPSGTAEGRGVAMSILAGESQKLMTCPETKALLDELSARADELDLVHRREVEELRRRLESRCTDTPEVIDDRIARAEYELTFAPRFDTIVVNDDLEKAKAEALARLKAFLHP